MEFLDFIINPEAYLSPENLRLINIFRAIFVFVSFLMIGSIFYFILNSDHFKDKYIEDIKEISKSKGKEGMKMANEWKKIEERGRDEDEAERKLAVIEADNLLERSLERMGFKGSNLEEKLNQVSIDVLPNLNEVRAVHRSKRDIIYDPNYDLTQDETERILLVYRKSLEDLQII